MLFKKLRIPFFLFISLYLHPLLIAVISDRNNLHPISYAHILAHSDSVQSSHAVHLYLISDPIIQSLFDSIYIHNLFNGRKILRAHPT